MYNSHSVTETQRSPRLRSQVRADSGQAYNRPGPVLTGFSKELNLALPVGAAVLTVLAKGIQVCGNSSPKRAPTWWRISSNRVITATLSVSECTGDSTSPAWMYRAIAAA